MAIVGCNDKRRVSIAKVVWHGRKDHPVWRIGNRRIWSGDLRSTDATGVLIKGALRRQRDHPAGERVIVRVNTENCTALFSNATV